MLEFVESELVEMIRFHFGITMEMVFVMVWIIKVILSVDLLDCFDKLEILAIPLVGMINAVMLRVIAFIMIFELDE